MRLIAIDPVKNKVAWAGFDTDDKELLYVAAGTVETMCEHARRFYGGGIEVLIECPQVYQQRYLKGDPNDLIQVAITVGRLREAFGAGEFVLPHIWKGNASKPIMHGRILRALSREENAAFVRGQIAAAHRGDVLDAIGIGLWRLGRLKRAAP
jgi:hypothetical protein